MKKLLIGLSLLLFLTSPVLAVDATRSGRKVERVENRIERRAQFQERLKTIKDERKQKLTETITNQLNAINDRATKAMLQHLERLQALLNKIKERVPTVDITAAQAKIDEAKAAVETQAAKEYVIEFTDESGLRVGASTAKTTLRADIKAVREKVRLARQAVVDILKAAKSL